MNQKQTFFQRLRRLDRDENGQGFVEVVVLAVLVAISLAWIVGVFPEAIKTHYRENTKILASPL